MKQLLKNTLLTLLTCSLIACSEDDSSQMKIGIVVPIEHTAMSEITKGLSDTLSEIYHQPVKIKIANAQGDVNLQRAIIQQMRDQNYAVIIPIGLNTTQMTLSMIHQQPIVALAADITESERKKLQPCNLAVVHDEISPEQLVAFIHAVYPTLTQLSLIHSSSEKVYPQVQAAIAAGKANGITIKPIMVSTLPDLYTAAHAIPEQTQGIFILKDHLIVSGVSTLANLASTRHIPLISSDQGSVQDGAGFALGVHESDIGAEGAKLIAAILQGKPACSLPITEMKTLTVFINSTSLKNEMQNSDAVESAAKRMHYHVETITGKQ